MPLDRPETPARDRSLALVVVCVLALASLTIALLGAAPRPVTATELLGQTRAPGEQAFVAGHRGDSSSAPENTLPAVTAAIAAGFDYVEVDVRLTADGIPVLMHDATVDRTTDGRGQIAEMTLAQVQGLDAGGWFDPRFAGVGVPTAAAFLDVIAATRARAIIEVKGEWDAAAAAALVRAIADRGLERRVAIASFDVGLLALVAAESDVIARLAIFRELPQDAVQAAADIEVRGIIVARREITAQPELVAQLQAHDVRVVVYTLNDDDHWADAVELGVDGIVTDDPTGLASWQKGIAG